MEEVNYRNCMQNRELSWLKFNLRVLEEADCLETPLLERCHFLSIFTTNLDEFFMVRVGSLIDYMLYSEKYIDNKTGMTAAEQLDEIYKACGPLYTLRDQSFERLMGELSKEDIQLMKMGDLKKNELKEMEDYFKREVLPVLSPQIVDSSHPFPHLPNKQLNIAVTLKLAGRWAFGIIPVPAAVSRIIWVGEGAKRFVLAEDLILFFIDRVFEQYKVMEKAVIAVTRNADIDMDAGVFDDDLDYRSHVKKILKKRLRLSAVRLEIQGSFGDEGTEYLREKLNLQKAQIFRSAAPLDLSFVFALDNALPAEKRRSLLNPSFVPQQTPLLDPNVSVIKQVMQKDVLLCYPYESMKPMLTLLKEAAADPEVLSIKITLYRIAKQSVLAETLIEAVENGKEVTVLMELRARFDEANNIEWAQRLEDAGCRVIYGMDGFKVHSKICLITRRERGIIRYITQIGTGNYNEKTARLYTDFAFITADSDIGSDASAFFTNLSLSNLYGGYHDLWVAPSNFKMSILRLAEEEIRKAKAGVPARIMVKCNSFTDKDLIAKFIEASMAGVKIRLVIRGICCLIPKVPGLTENIEVVSIVGRFLEHARIYAFGQGEETKVFIASGDMMTRNTERRVEVACPVGDPALKGKLLSMMETMLSDNVKGRELFADGQYVLRTPKAGEKAINAQEIFMEEAKAAKPGSFKEEKRETSFFKRLFSRLKK